VRILNEKFDSCNGKFSKLQNLFIKRAFDRRFLRAVHPRNFVSLELCATFTGKLINGFLSSKSVDRAFFVSFNQFEKRIKY